MTPVSTGALALITTAKSPVCVYQAMLVTSARLVSLSAVDTSSVRPPGLRNQLSDTNPPTVLSDAFRLGAMRARLG